LQSAHLAEQAGADSELIAAALLHDVGHLLHDLPEDAPDQGVDDRHEVLGERWLEQHFGGGVVEPVRLHVDAKRYLCTVEPEYRAKLSGPSLQSFLLQGAEMSGEEVRAFESREHFERAVRLRRWDDLAKDPQAMTPGIEHFASHLDRALGAIKL
jgi:predicted HD phosphohydrolase